MTPTTTPSAPRASVATPTTHVAVTELLAEGAIHTHLQPIVRLTDGEIVGFEALSRSTVVSGTPDQWFAAAATLGLGPQLEAACLHAVAAIGSPPAGQLLFVNVAPGNIGSDLVAEALDLLPSDTVIELTEQDAIVDPPALRRQLARWTQRGMRLALDDVGAGYAGLHQIVRLRPEFLKLDRGLIADITEDRTRQALLASLVGFAKQAGISLIAEGVETDGQLRWLREAGVALGQGFFFAHPATPWPSITTSTTTRSSLRATVLAGRLEQATTTREACEAAADHLFALGEIMPSIYLEAGGRLRCLAQRGLWQVLDGMAPTAGITGLTFRTGEPQLIPDVRLVPDYLEAIPGVVAELCIPVWAGRRVVGALNVESLGTLSPRVIGEVTTVGEMLGNRIAQLPSEPGVGPLRKLATLAANLVAVSDPEETAAAVVLAGCELTGLDSGIVVLDDEDHDGTLVGARGPLGPALSGIPDSDIEHLVTLLAPLTSCYSSGEATGRTFVGGQTLRTAGACSVIVIPLVARGRRTGLLILASSSPVSLGVEVIEPVELLATLAGSCLEVATHLDELESRVRLDALTGLANHARFHESLRELADDEPIALVMFDVDGFKRVNDTHGHLIGDQLLRDIARSMTASSRSGTRLYRVGGDELAAILPGSHHRDAEAVARRLTAAAIDVLRAYGAGVSAGVAIRLPGEPPIETLAKADAALYRAKRSGTGVEIG